MQYFMSVFSAYPFSETVRPKTINAIDNVQNNTFVAHILIKKTVKGKLRLCSSIRALRHEDVWGEWMHGSMFS
jgi:hypothetical protein